MDMLRTFLEQQQLLSMFLVIRLRVCVGRGEHSRLCPGRRRGAFVGLAAGMLVPKAAPPALLGSARPADVCLWNRDPVREAILQRRDQPVRPQGERPGAPVAPCRDRGLLSGLRRVLGHAVGCRRVVLRCADQHAGTAGGHQCGRQQHPALGYSVAYPFGFIAPILCMYFANLWVKPKLPAVTGTGLELREIVVRNAQVIGRPLAEVSAALPAGVQIVVVREGHQNRVPAPDIVLNHDDVVAVAGESAEALEQAQALIGASVPGRITKDRLDLDYFRLFVSRAPWSAQRWRTCGSRACLNSPWCMCAGATQTYCHGPNSCWNLVTAWG